MSKPAEALAALEALGEARIRDALSRYGIVIAGQKPQMDRPRCAEGVRESGRCLSA
jgi:hypothetical protein